MSTKREATAVAHANVALVKYWGKADAASNLPAMASLSITLDGLSTRSHVRFIPGGGADRLRIDGRDQDPARVTACLDLLRRRAGVDWSAQVESSNDFPTGAGLASSASGFAALVTAAAAALGIELEQAERSELARRGSGSAARSIYGGFVELVPAAHHCVTRSLLAPEAWPLEVVVAVTSRAAKAVSSSSGMVATASSSAYYGAWLATHAADMAEAREAVRTRDFDRLAEVAEASCLKMHAAAMAARPGLLYWNPATVGCLNRVRELRVSGARVFFTIDAGPQLKAVCAPGEGDIVAAALREVAGVEQVLRSGIGPGARVVRALAT